MNRVHGNGVILLTALNQDLLFRTPNVYSWGGGFDLSPDGRSIVYMWNGSGHWELYLLPIERRRTPAVDLRAGKQDVPAFLAGRHARRLSCKTTTATNASTCTCSIWRPAQ